MKIYNLTDTELKKKLGCLLYFERERSFVAELSEDLDEWTCPFLFSGFVQKGIYTIPRDISNRWVRERIIPSGRQNIASILANHRMSEYDEAGLLEISRGKCSQDSITVTRADNLPEYLMERDRNNLLECSVSGDGMSLLCFFKNGETKKAHLKQLLCDSDTDKLSRNRKLFESVRIVSGGRFVSFDNAIDIPSRVLYAGGIPVPVSLDDIKLFVKYNLLDTTQTCGLFECSRQNLAYMVKEEKIRPVKENIKGNLYIKGELLAENHGHLGVHDDRRLNSEIQNLSKKGISSVAVSQTSSSSNEP